MKFHPIANLFPMMFDEELAQLSRDIKEQGLREAIVTFDGQILDGRNRFRACESAGVPPRFSPFEGSSAIAFVVSANLRRRHLTDSQKAAVAVNVLPLLEAEAKKRVGGRPKSGEKPTEIIPGVSRESRDQAGAMLGVSGKYVSEAKAIQKQSPAVFKEVADGKKTIPQAKRELKREEVSTRLNTVAAKEPDAPVGKFDVIVIDPPWPMEKVDRDCRENQVGFDKIHEQPKTRKHRRKRGTFAVRTLQKLAGRNWRTLES